MSNFLAQASTSPQPAATDKTQFTSATGYQFHGEIRQSTRSTLQEERLLITTLSSWLVMTNRLSEDP